MTARAVATGRRLFPGSCTREMISLPDSGYRRVLFFYAGPVRGLVPALRARIKAVIH